VRTIAVNATMIKAVPVMCAQRTLSRKWYIGNFHIPKIFRGKIALLDQYRGKVRLVLAQEQYHWS